jgi:hypothetical protein
MARASLFPQTIVPYGTIRPHSKGDNKQNAPRAPLYRAAFCNTRKNRQRKLSKRSPAAPSYAQRKVVRLFAPDVVSILRFIMFTFF